jgi:hypothetical protein
MQQYRDTPFKPEAQDLSLGAKEGVIGIRKFLAVRHDKTPHESLQDKYIHHMIAIGTRALTVVGYVGDTQNQYIYQPKQQP